MSEIRSWDGECCAMGDSTEGIFPTVFSPGKLLNQHHNIKVRVVAWPEGAPKQEDVPQAGEVRIWRGKEYTIMEGIPFQRSTNYTWSLRCIDDRKTSSIIPVGDFEEIPSTPAQTYTEEEIREAMTDAEEVYNRHKASSSFSQILIDELNMRKKQNP